MNFVLAMSAFLFNGILDQVAKQMQIPLAETGFLNSAYAYGAGFGVPSPYSFSAKSKEPKS